MTDCMTDSLIPPGFLALHSHRSEVLAETLSGWLVRQPLAPLEQEVVLVQSNGMAEWIKMALAQQGGVCAATKVELPSRFLWRTYRQVLGVQNVPPDSPLDKLPMTWRLMALLPSCVGQEVFKPVAGFLQGDEPDRLLQLASRLADLFDQYQIYRPDWLEDWALGAMCCANSPGRPSCPVLPQVSCRQTSCGKPNFGGACWPPCQTLKNKPPGPPCMCGPWPTSNLARPWPARWRGVFQCLA